MAVINNNNEGAFLGEKIKSKSWLFFFILFALVLGFAVYYFSEITKEIKLLEQINPYWLLVAVLGQFFTYLFTAASYRFLLGTQKLQYLPSLWDLFKASIVSLFFNQTMPSVGISGNTFFFGFLAKLNVKVFQIISIILAELLIFYTAMEFVIVFLLITCIFFYPTPHVFTVTLLSGFAIYLVFATLMILSGRKKSIEFLTKKIQSAKLLKKLFKHLIEKIQQQHISEKDVRLLPLLKSNWKTVVKTFFAQVLVILADGFTLFALFYGLGVPISPFVVLICLISTKVISIIPFLPGALILYESSMSFFFVSMQIPMGTAIIVTLVYRLLSFWFPIPIGLFLYRRWLKKSPSMADFSDQNIVKTKR